MADTTNDPDFPMHNSGLPAVSPDFVEQDFPETIDNMIPTRGYEMLPMVGLGGSAGSIQALQDFFKAMPAETGMVFVVILHLSPEHESAMPELLQRATSMRVEQAHDGQKVEANCVYVIPPGKHLASTDGHLRLTELEPEKGKRVAVDLFFRSLADTHGPHAAAIVLSGADGDGALGIKRIKERGGLTIAQDPDEAEHPSMPHSSIATGMVDWVLKVAEMPARLVDYKAREDRVKVPPEEGPPPVQAAAAPPDQGETALREVLNFLRARTGRDFSYYKRATIVRRVARRMQINAVDELPDYLSFLRTHPGEAGALLQDLLISVTNFFRDRDSFAALELLIPQLFHGKTSQDTVRLWTPACATGEETYSLAMLAVQHARTLDAPPAIQVFGCDTDDAAVQVARAGVYPDTITADVSEARLQKFFTKEHRGYRVRRELRELVLFAAHDLLKDAPFSRMDLVSCRNLLIYLNRDAQQRAMEIFHFALKPQGLLFLGTSESVDERSALFAVVEKKHRIYSQRPAHKTALPVPMGRNTLLRALEAQEQARGGPVLPARAFQQLPGEFTAALAQAEREIPPAELHFELIERFAPPSVVVNKDYDIVHMSEHVARFLELTGGEPTLSLLRLVHPMLRVELRTALFQAAETNLPAHASLVPVDLEGSRRAVDIRVSPARERSPGYFLVVFEMRDAPATGEAAAEPRAEPEPIIRQLEREMESMKSRMRDNAEQYEASNEELKASNEELQAMNEELRSASEELETGREEMQSINEELATVNQELKSKLEELGQANSDLHNLMASTAIPTIFLDRDRCIMRYTPTAVPLFNLIPGDIGRPLANLTSALEYPDLNDDAERVLQHLAPVEREVRADAKWFLVHVLPYRTLDDRIAGVVLTFVDITENKRTGKALQESEARLRTLADAVPQVIWTNSNDGTANYFNRRWFEYTGLTFEQSAGPGWQAVVHPDDAPASKERWQQALAVGEIFDSEYRLRGADGNYRWFIGRNVPMRDASGRVTAWFGTATDIHELKTATAALRASEEQFRRAIEDAPIPMIMQAEDGQVLQISRTWTELTGYTQEDIPTFEAWLNQAYGPGAEEVRAHVHRLFAGDARELDVEIEITTRSGETRCWAFSASAPGTLRDGRRFIVGMALDITERKAGSAALSESQERMRLIVENAREYAIFSMSLDRRITSWNAGAKRILGYSQEEAMGQPGDVIFTPEDRAAGAPEAEAEQAITEGRAADERWHLCKDGRRFWGSGVMMSMHDAHGAAIGLLKVFRDHTEQLLAQKNLEQALQETEAARAEAEAAGKAKDHFLAVLSHELRTPLTPVLMSVDFLMLRQDLPAQVLEALEMIQRNVTLESQFIDELLDLTRISRGKFELNREPMDLHAAIRLAAEVASPDIEEKSQRLTLELNAETYELIGDTKRLQQVFWNLLKNAAKFTPEGGTITVRSRNAPASDSAQPQIVVEVSDTGIGFESDAAERIFTAFAQANETIAQQFGGLGLGLAISKATVDAQGGIIRASSAGANQGASFTVSLPLSGLPEDCRAS